MQTLWPRNDNILNWDPENMDKYWELCARYDQYPHLDQSSGDVESASGFCRAQRDARRDKIHLR